VAEKFNVAWGNESLKSY